MCTVFEIFVLCLSGGIAARGISAIIAPMQSTSQYMVRLEGHSVVLLTATVLGMAALVCGILSSCVKIKEPVAALTLMGLVADTAEGTSERIIFDDVVLREAGKPIDKALYRKY